MKTIILKFFTIFAILLIYNRTIAQFNFVHITDLHVADNYCAGAYDLDGEMFVLLRNEINNLSPKPAFVVATGDISHVGASGTDGMYAAITDHLYPANVLNPGPGDFFMDSLQTIPIYFTPGNHDFRTGNVPPLNDENLTEYLNIICSSSDYFINYQNTIIICMNSGYDDLRPLWDDTNYMSPEGSGFSDEQCTWLRTVLVYYSTHKKIIAMHHPTVNKVGVWCDGTPFSGTILDHEDGSIKYNRTTLLDICDTNNVDIVLAGHAHQNIVVNRFGQTVNENWSDSTRFIQTGAALYGCYRIISVDSTSVSVSPPISLGTTQIRPYSEEIYFNVYPNPFNDNTTVEIYANNKAVDIEFIIYNIFGNEVKKTSNISTNIFDLNRDGLSSGMYFFKISKHNIIIGTGKLIIN